jgi:hypothetical protein
MCYNIITVRGTPQERKRERKMKVFKRAQSTLNNEAKPLLKHPENIIYKTKNEVEYMWQYPCDETIYYTTIHYGKNGNIVRIIKESERNDEIVTLELR